MNSYDVYILAQQRSNVKSSDTKTVTEQTDKSKTVTKDQKKSEPQSQWTFFIMMGAMVLIFYFLLIRPQKKKQQEHDKFVNAIKKGDKVVTQAGIYGRVAGVADNTVTVEIAQGVRVKMLKSSIVSFENAQPATSEKNTPVKNVQSSHA